MSVSLTFVHPWLCLPICRTCQITRIRRVILVRLLSTAIVACHRYITIPIVIPHGDNLLASGDLHRFASPFRIINRRHLFFYGIRQDRHASVKSVPGCIAGRIKVIIVAKCFNKTLVEETRGAIELQIST